MVSSRPLLYLSLPGVAFILGVFWFRRRNKNRTDNIGDTIAGTKDTPIKDTEVNEALIQKANGKPVNATKSMTINGDANIGLDEDNTITVLFGKSAPIKIVQNGRCSPVTPAQQQQIDSEILKSKIQDVEQKTLRSIEEDFENLSSSVDLPDSVNNRVSPFYSRNVSVTKDEPVVIKASRTPKISPENSFLESKYTKKECEQNNNCESNESHTINEIPTPNDTEIIVENNEVQQTDLIDNKKTDTDTKVEKRDVDAASPSLSLCSEQSGDSGKGSSLPRSEAARAKTTYEFFLPNSLVGQLYGRKHAYVKQIKAKTMAKVSISENRYSPKVRICVIEGTESQINAALLMIRQRLPSNRFPNFTMQRIYFALPQTVVPLSNESLLNLKLNLIEGINNDVTISAVISGGHVFVQHPLHPSHPSLPLIQKHLYESYTGIETPLLPNIEISAVCVMPVNGVWYRVQIVQKDEEEDERCIIKFLDFGGYMNVHFHELRQIRSDFMGVPFQATECVLSNIEPYDSCWSAEAADVLCKLCKGIVLQAQVAGYNSHNIPEIYLFACLGPNNVIFINKELVARNLAQWVEVQD